MGLAELTIDDKGRMITKTITSVKPKKENKMKTLIVKKGNKKASIQLPVGFSIKDIVKALNIKNTKNDYLKLKLNSIKSSDDNKRIVFDFDDKNQIFFDMASRKFIDGSPNGKNKVISAKKFSNFFAKDVPAFSLNHARMQLIQDTDSWIYNFLTILELNYCEYFSCLTINKNKDLIDFAEKLSKLSICQKMIKEASFDSLREYEILSISRVKNKDKFNINDYIKDFEWILNNCNVALVNHPAVDPELLFAYITEFSSFSTPRLDLFKYAFENYRYLLSPGSILEYIQNLIKKGYEPKRLIDYILRDLPNQGYYINDDDCVEEAVITLRDYANMCLKINQKDFEKYPRYLKTYHDIANKNYQVLRDQILKKNFEKAVKAFGKYEYSNSTHSLIKPKNTEDLVREGSVLHHCVASYSDRVADGETAIMFLRKKDDLNTPLVTVEIKGNKIAQAKGKNNSNVVGEEYKFLEEYKKAHLSSLK